jgi:3-oxoacyl-[acyl-carrier protein] reductase
VTDLPQFSAPWRPLDGQVAIVTGAGSATGIGFATARLLAEQGAAVLLAATSARVHDRAAELCADGHTAVAFVADLTDATASQVLVDTARADLGRLDVLVNNAGMVSVAAGSDTSAALEHLTREAWDDALARNLTTAFLVCRAAVPVMRSGGYGRIVNMASVTGPVVSMPDSASYSAAKAGMVGLTRALAIEVGRDNITVNAVAPGWIDTESATDDERRAGLACPVGRSGSAREVAAAAVFLASPGASYITGTTLVVDGGNTIVEDRSGGVWR